MAAATLRIARLRIGADLGEEIVVAEREVRDEQPHVGVGDDIGLDEGLAQVDAPGRSQTSVEPVVDGELGAPRREQPVALEAGPRPRLGENAEKEQTEDSGADDGEERVERPAAEPAREGQQQRNPDRAQ